MLGERLRHEDAPRENAHDERIRFVLLDANDSPVHVQVVDRTSPGAERGFVLVSPTHAWLFPLRLLRLQLLDLLPGVLQGGRADSGEDAMRLHCRLPHLRLVLVPHDIQLEARQDVVVKRRAMQLPGPLGGVLGEAQRQESVRLGAQEHLLGGSRLKSSHVVHHLLLPERIATREDAAAQSAHAHHSNAHVHEAPEAGRGVPVAMERLLRAETAPPQHLYATTT
mmetsp:Transcript_9982/g.37708  ORF Transcript_9982/g.37708 Transcript_9982/m.37708 type:complete len:224 (-) Transcript_9982:83-754(-)